MSVDKKKVLMIACRTLDNGGVQAVMMDITRNCQDACSFDMVVFTKKEGFYDKEFLSYGGRIFRIPRFYEKFGFLKIIDYYIRAGYVYKNLKKIMLENGPYDVVHCHNEEETALALLAAEKAGIPIKIAHTHTQRCMKTKNPFARFYKWVYRKIIEGKATYKLGCSVDACRSFYLNAENALVINNPYNSQKFDYDKYGDYKVTEPSLVQIGNFSHNKNQIFSLEVIYEIKKEYPNVHFDMIGSDIHNTLTQIKQKIKSLSLEDNVTIHPGDANSPELLSKATGFLFPSQKEGFGIVAIEAQAMGVKCYASDTVPKLTNCGGCEYLPLSAGAKYWADIIIKDFKTTGGKRQRYDCSRFSAEKIARDYKDIYGGKSLNE
ncbi:MAG: glycosyltransferase [Clostridia bacterium]|nr:glycosyltransferase [Clostridia bacterium]